MLLSVLIQRSQLAFKDQGSTEDFVITQAFQPLFPNSLEACRSKQSNRFLFYTSVSTISHVKFWLALTSQAQEMQISSRYQENKTLVEEES